jgi:hypothetical protein
MRKVVALVAMAVLSLGLLGAAPASAAVERVDFEDCDGPEDPFNVIVGTRDRDRLVGTNCNDHIFGRGDNDVLRGRLGYDILRGMRGDDRLIDVSFLVGGELRGGPGWDTCLVAVDSPVNTFSCEDVIEVG